MGGMTEDTVRYGFTVKEAPCFQCSGSVNFGLPGYGSVKNVFTYLDLAYHICAQQEESGISGPLQSIKMYSCV